MLSYRSSQQDRLPQQTNIRLSVSSFGLLLLFPKNLASLRSFFLGVPEKRYALWGIFSGALLKYARVRGIPIIRSNIQKSTLKRVFFVLICGKSFNAFELIL